MQKELIYQIINGDVDSENLSLPANITIENEFEDGSECSILYDKAYEAKLRLLEKLGVGEDSDIEEIVSSISEISKILAFKMYDYGNALAGYESVQVL